MWCWLEIDVNEIKPFFFLFFYNLIVAQLQMVLGFTMFANPVELKLLLLV